MSLLERVPFQLKLVRMLPFDGCIFTKLSLRYLLLRTTHCDVSYAVRNRMKSVKNIQKITKAMKMVAASKLRLIQTRAENSRGLWQPFTALLGDTPSML